MYRFIFLMVIAVVSIYCHGAEPPASLKYLDGYFNNNPDASVTVVVGKPLKDYDLDEYRGLTVKHSPDVADKIEVAVKEDSQTAVDKEMAYRQGKLYYAFLTLPKEKDGHTRYIFFLNQKLAKGDKVILIYMRGRASADKIRTLIKK